MGWGPRRNWTETNIWEQVPASWEAWGELLNFSESVLYSIKRRW